jgi:multimeric flavodoxin WrbA
MDMPPASSGSGSDIKRVVAFVGSARKRHTFDAVGRFMRELETLGPVESEIVRLSDFRIGTCRGCLLCLDKGEELCPLKDDRDALIEKMRSADGVVFASPKYSFQVSGLMKVFLDRLGFVFHRPEFFGKTSTSIIVQGVYGGPKIVKYLHFVGGALGFNAVKGSCLLTREPITDKQRRKNDRNLAGLARRFDRRLGKPAFPKPSFLGLMLFRLGRTSRKLMLDESWRDFTHFRDKGWFESDYYYPVSLGPLKKLAGRLFDAIAVLTAKKK